MIILNISLIIALSGMTICLYGMYHNNKTYSTLIQISNELKYKLQMAKSKEDVEEITSIMKKIVSKDRYHNMVFSLKPFKQLDYELRKDIGML